MKPSKRSGRIIQQKMISSSTKMNINLIADEKIAKGIV
jgi:hypothetical protein